MLVNLINYIYSIKFTATVVADKISVDNSTIVLLAVSFKLPPIGVVLRLMFYSSIIKHKLKNFFFSKLIKVYKAIPFSVFGSILHFGDSDMLESLKRLKLKKNGEKLEYIKSDILISKRTLLNNRFKKSKPLENKYAK
jgi:hypothetical protein